MIRVFLTEQDSIKSEKLKIKHPASLRHLRVLRPSLGEAVEVLDGRGTVIYGKFASFDRTNAVIDIESRALFNRAKPYVILCCALITQNKFDLVIDHACEFGIDEIVPMITDRSEVKKVSESKINRWQRLMIEALKQCGNPFLPRLNSPMLFEDALNYCRDKTQSIYIASLAYKSEPHLLDVLLAKEKDGFSVFIGPEGDFSDRELSLANSEGAIGVSLGNNVLRVETAASCVGAIASYMKFNKENLQKHHGLFC